VYVPYVRPGFPLAHAVSRIVDQIPSRAIGMTLAHHGLVVWADSARECYDRLIASIKVIEDFLAKKQRRPPRAQRSAPGSSASGSPESVLPVVLGVLGRVVLHFDGAEDLLSTLAIPDLRDVVRRGVATPEHILRAGRAQLWLGRARRPVAA